MAFLKLNSNNENLSWIINKNPESGLQIRSLKKGKLFSWFNNNDYCVYFKDAQNEISYKSDPDEDFEYLNVSRYTASSIYLDMLSNLFNKPNLDYDKEPRAYIFTIGSIKIHNLKYVEIFNRYFKDKNIWIDTNELANKTYGIEIKGVVTFNEIYHFVRLFLLFNVIKSDEFNYLDPQIIGKYIKSLEVIDAPYFIRYVFKINLLREMKWFKENKQILEISKDKIEMEFGDNAIQRQKFLFEHYNFDKQVIDIGCGEGRYGLKIAEKIQDKGFQYIAIDPDKECRRAIYWKSKSRKLNNVKLFKSLGRANSYLMSHSKFLMTESTCFLLIEVIEHLEKEDIKNLINKIKVLLDLNKESQLIITTPNKNFNLNYFEDETETRHEAHISEMSENEFYKLITAIFFDITYTLEFKAIGDKVNGITPTQAVIIKRK